jgi:hypothetical protein
MLSGIIGIGNITATVLTFIFGCLIAFLILISGGLCQIAGAILNWVTSPGFISLSYTTNEIVNMGLDITQDFVNLILVIFLVFIALSIALKIGDYAGKKVFAKLILVALLVNFAPVFVGLIVDASNIVMNFFLQGIGTGVSDTGAGIYTFVPGLSKTLTNLSGDLSDKVGILTMGATQIIVNLAMGLAFFLFAALFLTRYVVIWILTILSPLAFVFWILPATKKFWDMWWQALIQWSIVGIPIAFFLYLAMNSFVLLQQAFVGQLNAPGLEPTVTGWFDQIFPFFVIIIFLILGFTVGLQTGAMGAGAVIGLAKGAGKKSAKWAGKKTWEKGKEGMRQAMPSGVREKAERMATYAPKSKIGRALGALPAAGIRAMGRAMGPGLEESRKKDISSARAEAEKIETPKLLASKVKGALGVGGSIDKAIGLTTGGIKKGAAFQNELRSVLSEEEMVRLGLEANKLGDVKSAESLGRTFLDKADKMGFKELNDKDTAKGYNNITDKLIGEAKGDEIKEFGKDFWKDKETGEIKENIMGVVQKSWSGPQLGKAADEFGRNFIDDYTEQASLKEKEHPGWFMENNQKAIRYIKNNAAQDLGFDPLVFKAPATGWTPPSDWESSDDKPDDWIPGSPPPNWRPIDKIPPGWAYTSPSSTSATEEKTREKTSRRPRGRQGVGKEQSDISAPWGIEDAEYEDIPPKKKPPRGRPGVGGL